MNDEELTKFAVVKQSGLENVEQLGKWLLGESVQDPSQIEEILKEWVELKVTKTKKPAIKASKTMWKVEQKIDCQLNSDWYLIINYIC